MGFPLYRINKYRKENKRGGFIQIDVFFDICIMINNVKDIFVFITNNISKIKQHNISLDHS